MWKNNEFKMCYSKGSILEFERIILSSGECDRLLPMIFINEDSNNIVYYDCKGFVPLSRYTVDRTEDALFVLEKVLLILHCVIEHLITPGKITLTTDTVFFNANTGEIKIAYVPTSEESAGLRRHILTLISQLKSEISDNHTDYLDSFALLIYENSHQLRDLINKLGFIRRKLYFETNGVS